MSDNLDDVAQELAAANKEVWRSLLLVASYVQIKAVSDPVAAHLDELVRAAFDRITVANINGTTALAEQEDRL